MHTHCLKDHNIICIRFVSIEFVKCPVYFIYDFNSTRKVPVSTREVLIFGHNFIISSFNYLIILFILLG